MGRKIPTPIPHITHWRQSNHAKRYRPYNPIKRFTNFSNVTKFWTLLISISISLKIIIKIKIKIKNSNESSKWALYKAHNPTMSTLKLKDWVPLMVALWTIKWSGDDLPLAQGFTLSHTLCTPTLIYTCTHYYSFFIWAFIDLSVGVSSIFG